MTSCAADQEPRAAKQLCRHVVPARLVALADLLWIDSQGVPWHDVIATLGIYNNNLERQYHSSQIIGTPSVHSACAAKARSLFSLTTHFA